MTKTRLSFCIFGFFALALFVAGCSSPKDQAAGTKGKPAETGKTDGEHGPKPGQHGHKPGEHSHKPGQHGGTIVEIGRNNYHAEAVFGDKGLVRLYMLAKDEAQVQEVESQALTAHAKVEGETKSVELKLEARPRPGDSKGKTSIFEGTLPESLHDKRVEVTVPAIHIGGARFQFSFKNYKEGQHSTHKDVTSEKAKTTGGKHGKH